MPARAGDIEKAGLRVEDLSREGRCLVAARKFPAGALLFTERPLTGPSAEAVAARVAQDPDSFTLLRGSESIRSRLQSERDGAPLPPFLAEAETNTFVFGGRVVLFHAFSMLNHSCAGSWEENACFSVLFTGDSSIDDDTEVQLVAVRNIAADEPVRISYHELFAEGAAKAERLQAHCGGDSCGCSLCLGNRPLTQLHRTLAVPLTCQRCAVRGSSVPVPQKDDIVLVDGLGAAEYNGLLGRVLQGPRTDGRLMVLILFQAAEKQLWVKPDKILLVEAGQSGLQQCARCSAVSYCSRDCQRADWKAHKGLCGASCPHWEEEYLALRALRARLDQPAVRQQCSPEEARRAFEQAERFIARWTQHGRARRPAAGHQAMQEAALFGTAAGTIALGRRLAVDGFFDAAFFASVVALALLHQKAVLAAVPRFHIAHWKALYNFRGLLTVQELQTGKDAVAVDAAGRLRAELQKHIDVVRVFDSVSADSFAGSCSLGDDALGGAIGGLAAGGGDAGEAAKIFQALSADPSMLARFNAIDASAPLEERMQQMAQFLQPSTKLSPPKRSEPSRGRETPQRKMPSVSPAPKAAATSAVAAAAPAVLKAAPLIVEVEEVREQVIAVEGLDEMD